MKLKRVYQQGGGLIYTPFIPEGYGAPKRVSSGKSSGEDDPKLDPLDKEMLALMKDKNLLPSDIQMIYDKLTDFQRRSQHLTSLGGTNAYRSVMPGMLQIQHMISLAMNNKENWDNSVKAMKEHGAGSEIALDSYGRMWVRNHDDKGLELIDPSQFDKEKHTPVSYSQLMFFRRSEPEMAFSTQPFEELGEHIVGMKDARAAIQGIIDKFGKIKSSSFEAREIQNLANAVSEAGYFNVSNEKTRSIASPETLNAFTQLVWDNLDSNIQHMLIARASVTEDKNPLNLLRKWVFADSDDSTTISFDASMSKAAGGAGNKSTGAEHLTQDNYLQQIGNKRLYKTTAAIVPTASQVWETGTMVVPVYSAGAPVDKQMDVLGKMSLSEFRKKAEATKAGDMSSITFGNRVLKGNETDMVMYDGSSELNIAMLPYKSDPETGQITPDFSVLVKFNTIQQFLKDHPGASELEIAEHAKSLGIDWNSLNYDKQTNSISIRDTMPFITFSAYVGSDSFNVDRNIEPFLEHVDGSMAKPMLNAYNNVINYGKADPKKGDRKINNFNTPERWNFYRGNVYVPMQNAARAMLLSGIGEYLPKSQMTDFADRVTARELEVAQAQMLQEQDPYYLQRSQQLGKF